MSLEQNKVIVRRFYEQAFSPSGDLGVADELLASDYVDHTAPPTLPPGIQGFKLLAQAWRSAFPDLAFTITEVVAEGNFVAVAWTGQGTQRGELMGIPPTHKFGTMAGITLNRLSDGRIAERMGNNDELGLLRQLGVIPA